MIVRGQITLGPVTGAMEFSDHPEGKGQDLELIEILAPIIRGMSS